MPATTEVILPPLEVQTVIDKTAGFVAKYGHDFEKRICQNEKDNPKFSFLFPNDVFHPYYLKKIEEFKGESIMLTPRQTETSQTTTNDNITPLTSQQSKIEETIEAQSAPKHGYTSLIQRMLSVSKKAKSNLIQLIPNLIQEKFILKYPSDLTALDLDVMKLTAQFVARNGHSFQIGLMNREFKNPQFEFLKQTHPLHPFFMSIVESYTRCLLPPKGIQNKLLSLKDSQSFLDQIILKFQRDKEIERKRREAEEKANQERMENSLIDWHDFIIVETIDFLDEEIMPPPEIIPPKEIKTTEEMEIGDMEVEESAKRPPSEMNIIRDYVKPSVNPAEVTFAKFKRQKCPLCEEDIPVDEIEQHMKVELLDPKYRNQRQQFVDKGKLTPVATDQEISKNLNAFAKKRTDIFGDKEVKIGVPVIPEPEKHIDDKLIWDGHTGSIAKAATALFSKPTEDKGINKLEEKMDSSLTKVSLNNTNIVPPPPPLPPRINTPNPPLGYMPSMMHMGMPPMYAYPGMPTMVEDEYSKRKKMDESQLIPENEFLQKYGTGPITVYIQVPKDEEKQEWNFNGQTISFQFNLTDSILAIKENIKNELGMPPNKQKLKGPICVLSKDQQSLAFYNITDQAQLILGIKERGKKKSKK